MPDNNARMLKHVACPYCTYDLYGLTLDWDEVRCPECGEQVSLSSARAGLRAKRVRRAKWVVIPCALLLLPAVFFTIWFVLERSAWSGGVMMLSIAGWLALLTRYQRDHREVEDAAWVLLMFHGSSGLLALGILIIGVGLSWPVAPRAFAVREAGVLIGLGICSFWLAWYLFKRACNVLEDVHDASIRRTIG